jgi:hypothetical protein
MILVDANLLIYAVNSDLAHHERSRLWWENMLSGADTVGIPWVSLLAFLRICTNRRVFENPMPIDQATGYVAGWLDQPVVLAISPARNHWSILRNLLKQSGTGGNLTTDAHIAALAVERGCPVYSADNDFKRFPGIRHINPLAN